MSGIYKLVSQSIKQRGRELKMGRFKCVNCGVYEMILTKGLCDDCVNKKREIEKEIYDFTLLQNIGEETKVGGIIYAPNNGKGKVLEIKYVGFNKQKQVIVKGKAELFETE
ncbi:hypothetical protein TU52_18740 [Bacillus cereus]|nr:hypothetical protein TU52_18740 [Bacillus cereus]